MTTWCAEDTTSIVPGRYAYLVIESITGIGILLLGTGKVQLTDKASLLKAFLHINSSNWQINKGTTAKTTS